MRALSREAMGGPKSESREENKLTNEKEEKESKRNADRMKQGVRTMVRRGGGGGGGGMGDGVVKDGVQTENGGEDRRVEEEEEVAVAGRVFMCKRFLQLG